MQREKILNTSSEFCSIDRLSQEVVRSRINSTINVGKFVECRDEHNQCRVIVLDVAANFVCVRLDDCGVKQHQMRLKSL